MGKLRPEEHKLSVRISVERCADVDFEREGLAV